MKAIPMNELSSMSNESFKSTPGWYGSVLEMMSKPEVLGPDRHAYVKIIQMYERDDMEE